MLRCPPWTSESIVVIFTEILQRIWKRIWKRNIQRIWKEQLKEGVGRDPNLTHGV